MTPRAGNSLSAWTRRYAIVVWIGIVLNLGFIVGLIFCPAWILGIFGLPLAQLVWARFAGWLLFIITCFYVPTTLDLQRYRAYAWLSIVPSRAGGALFFFLAVFVFGQPPGFLVGMLLDGSIGLATLVCLIKVESIERQQRTMWGRT